MPSWGKFKKSKNKAPEQQVKNQILLWLSVQAGVLAWPNASVGIYDPIKKIYRKPMSKFHRNGVGDILCVWFGHAVCIETKSKYGKQRLDQSRFQKDFEACGGTYILAKKLEDVTTIWAKKYLELARPIDNIKSN